LQLVLVLVCIKCPCFLFARIPTARA
jgi:hypothetical protein